MVSTALPKHREISLYRVFQTTEYGFFHNHIILFLGLEKETDRNPYLAIAVGSRPEKTSS